MLKIAITATSDRVGVWNSGDLDESVYSAQENPRETFIRSTLLRKRQL